MPRPTVEGMTTVPAPTASPTTGPSPTTSAHPRVTSPLRVGGAIAQMAALAIIGPVLFTILITLLSVGIGLIPVLGIGLVILVAGIYVLYAMSWLEHARVEGLYDFGLALPRPRRSGRPGFGGFLRTIWQQLIDGSTWRGIASVAVSTILGFVVLGLIGAFAAGIVLVFAPLFATTEDIRLFGTGLSVPLGWGLAIGVIQIIVGAAGAIGLGILHGVLARAILVPSQEAQLAEAARASSAQRDGAVRAADVERTRIERDLHDGVQPRLVSVGMTLGLAQQKIESDPDAAKELISEAHTSTKAAITELRQLARGIHASVLDDRGLDAALSALAARSHTPVQLDVRLDGRCSRDAEAAVYFAIAEALTNAAKHARAGSARVVVRLRGPVDGHGGSTLWARVEDDGIGGATIVPGGGLDGIMNRILAAGGQARLDSPAGGPTSLEVSVPCGS